MSDVVESAAGALELQLRELTQQRYPQAEDEEAQLLAARAGADLEWLGLHTQWLQARLQESQDDTAWMAPTARNPPVRTLARIRALCVMFPDLYSAMFAIAATHAAVPRERLAQAIKQFRPDAAPYSVEDLAGLLVAIVNGGNQAFEAILRTRRGAERKSGGFPFGDG
jgi:hypothetical protein